MCLQVSGAEDQVIASVKEFGDQTTIRFMHGCAPVPQADPEHRAAGDTGQRRCACWSTPLGAGVGRHGVNDTYAICKSTRLSMDIPLAGRLASAYLIGVHSP